MGKKNKKSAAKKKNEKKNKERAALVRKEIIEQKKAAQVAGKTIKSVPKKPKAGADDKNNKQRAKQEKAKEKQRMKDKKEKEKREANQEKRQEKIQKLKDRKKKAEKVKKKGKEEPSKMISKKESKPAKEKKQEKDKKDKAKKIKHESAPSVRVEQKETKKAKSKKQKKTDLHNSPAKVSEPDKENAPVFIETPIAETEAEAVSAENVVAEELAETVPLGNDPSVVPVEQPSEVGNAAFVLPVEQPLEVGNVACVLPVEQPSDVGNDPCVVPEDRVVVEDTQAAFSIADIVRSALSKPEETTPDADRFAEANIETDDAADEIVDEKPEKREQPDITENPLATLVHNALFNPEETVEETLSESDMASKQTDNVMQEESVAHPPIKKQKTEKPKKETKPKKEKKITKKKSVTPKVNIANLKKRITSAAKEKLTKMSVRTKRVVTITAAGFLMLAVVLIAVQIFVYSPPEKAVPVYRGLTESSVNVRGIEAEPERQLELVKNTKAHGKTRAFKFFAAEEAMIEEWYDKFPLVLGNLDSNECDFIVTILYKDTIVYRSMGITPGKYLPSIKLFEEMPYGSYELRVVVVGYAPQTFENIGVQHMKFKLVIGNEQGIQNETEQAEQ